MAGLPTLPVVVTTALVDAINPCAIGVLILLISTLVVLSRSKLKMLKVGVIYILAIYVTYFLAGLGLLFFIQRLGIAVILGVIVGVIIIIAGLVEIKDFFWYGKGFSLSIPANQVKKIEKYAKKVSMPGAIVLGIFVAAVELPCTGGPYLAITTLLARSPFDLKVISYLLLYNFIFVLPLIIILILAYSGTRIQKIKRWKQDYRRWMRLAIGLLLVGLGVLLILYSKNIISLG